MQKFLNARDRYYGIPMRARTKPRSAKALIALCKRKGVENLTNAEFVELCSRATLTNRPDAAQIESRQSLCRGKQYQALPSRQVRSKKRTSAIR